MTKAIRIISVLMIVILSLPVLASCSDKEIKKIREITPEDVITAYEAAGYEVWHGEAVNDPIKGKHYYVQANHENGDYIYFSFFDSSENAEAYADEREWNILLWLFSAIYGDPSWLTTEAYGNIEIEYDNKKLYEPFKDLVK